jgi:hypothetical protein
MRRSMLALVGFALAVSVGLIIYWRWFPRAGTKWANEVMNPWLVRQGWSGSGGAEFGTLEHFGRKTGTRHLTPVHPVPTPEGFRIVVPLAEGSQWAMNVLAAGHCRLHFHDTVFDLDEPLLVEPVDVRELSRPTRWAADRLGFKYLRLHRFAEHPGVLEPLDDTMLIDAIVPAETRQPATI